MLVIEAVLLFLEVIVADRSDLATEILAPRQQLAAFKQAGTPRAIRARDRIFWGALSLAWANWYSAFIIVQPGTVLR